MAPYLKKGKQVLVEGKLQTRKWTDQSGADKYTTELRADRVVLLGGPQQQAAPAHSSNGNQRRQPQNRRPFNDASEPF